MTNVAHATRPCPLCGGTALAPVFYPPLTRCSQCGLVFRNLQGLQEGVREGFDAIYSQPGLDQRVQARRGGLYREFLARHHAAPGRNRLVDVGCGAGQFLALAREQGWEVMGIEIAEAGVQAARAAGLPVLVGSLTTTTLPAASLDVVTYWNVLDCVPDPVEQLGAAKRVLAPGGLLFARVNNLTFHSALYRVSRLLQPRPRLADLFLRQYIFNQISFDRRTLRRALEQAGFRRIRIVNSPPVYGDPYRTGPPAYEMAIELAKRSVYGLAWLIASLTGGRLLWASSLTAEAVNEDG